MPNWNGATSAVLEGLQALQQAGAIDDGADHPAGPDFSAWQFIPFNELLAEPEPIPEIAPGLVQPGLVVVFGAPGSLKSLLLADLAVCVAAGKTWLEPLDSEPVQALQTNQTAAVWWDADNGKHTTQIRFSALLRGHGVSDPVPIYPYAMMNPPFLATDARAIVAMRDLLREHRAGLLVLDNLGTIAGTQDENSAEMVRVMSNLRWIAEQANCCIVLIHHQRKATGFKTRAGENLRGHSSIEAALDLALLVERDEQQRDLVTVRATKCRHEELPAFGARFTYEHRSNRLLHKARFFGATPALEAEERERMELERRLDAAILAAANGLSQRKLIDAVRHVVPTAGEKRILQRIEALQQAGRLRVQQAARGALAYHKV